ncbi:PTS sugar transporter subunit IIC [bacterium]|nr:MAG: PTS sugar transporter subunit IIC [bacterium]
MLRAAGEEPNLAAVRTSIPLAFIGLVSLLPLYLATPGAAFRTRFYAAFPAGFGVMSWALVVILSATLAKRLKTPRSSVVLVALLCFWLALPRPPAAGLVAQLAQLGSSGLFLAMLVALVTANAQRWGTRLAGTIGAATALTAVVAASVGLFAAHLSLAVGFTHLMAPLATLGDSLPAVLFIVIVETVLWMAGIHGPALVAPVVTPVYLHLVQENGNALAHGLHPPHIVTIAFFAFVFPGGAGATLALPFQLLRGGISRVRRIAGAALLPSLVNANEPLMFGLPVIANPALAVPFVVAPLVLTCVAYAATALHLVAPTVLWLPSSIPTVIFAYFATGGDWRAVVLAVVNVALAALIYLPFVRAYKRHLETACKSS